MHYVDRLHRLAINQADWAEDPAHAADVAWLEPDARSADPGPGPARRAGRGRRRGSLVRRRRRCGRDAGASAAEVVDVLVGVLPVVGAARVVAAAPRLAMALGYDTDALEQESAG